MEPWVRGSLILGGALVSLFVVFLVVALVLKARFAPPPAPPAPVAVAPPASASPSTPPGGSKLFSFNNDDSSENGSPSSLSPASSTNRPAALAPQPAAPPVSPAATTSTQPALPYQVHPAALPKHEVVTDDAINAALVKGVNYLLTRFDHGAYLGPENDQKAGTDALCVLALLHTSEAISDERLSIRGQTMAGLIDAMKGYAVTPPSATYTHSLRAQALAVYHRKEDRAALANETRWLIENGVRGAYTYHEPPKSATRPSDFNWDNSNSQYGALGVWAAADAGVPVPSRYWMEVQEHWEQSQSPDTGGWDYHQASGDSARLSMTAAGVNMLFVANEQLSILRPATQIARPPFSPSLQLGLDWLAQGDNAINISSGWPYYTLYGMERAGLACGFKMFGKHDWFRELASKAITDQQKDGSWGNDIDTAFAMLFLARGRHPLLMNKLHFVGAWANRPRDVAHLAAFVSKETERALNWQVVDLKSDWSEWMDSPILYIASHEAPIFDESDYDKLRQYVNAGGLIYTQADGGSKEFNQWAELLALKLFGQPLTDLPDNHFVYNAVYRPKQKFPLRGVSNQTRMLMIHSPTDIAVLWQSKQPADAPDAFELGANLYLYATGMDVPRNRVATLYVPALPGEAEQHVAIARLKYTGNWDPEPYAWVRESRLFRRETSIGLVITPVAIEQLTTRVAPLAHLTGTSALTLSEAQIKAIHDYVENGGVLLIDSCGGKQPFNDSMLSMLSKAFPRGHLSAIRTDHPMIAGEGPGLTQIAKPQVRPYVFRKLGEKYPKLQILESGKGAVLFSELDITSGLLGTSVLGIAGYQPDYAHALVRNAILWTINGRAVNPGSTRPARKMTTR
jgi:hypothetical protein